MTGLEAFLAEFHFLRPAWLWLVPVTGVLWWRVRRAGQAARPSTEGIAPHLAAALEVGALDQRRIVPVDLIAVVILLVSLAAAGPAWTRIPNPLVAQTAPMVIALEASESMERRDVAPSRFERARHKILDILGTRAGARTALIAYAGTAHVVVPLAEDPSIITPFLEGLSPEVMPQAGDNATAALALAEAILAADPTPGTILFVTDGVDAADLPAMAAHVADGSAPILVLGVTREEDALDGVAALSGIATLSLTPDDADVRAVERRAAAAYRAALAADETLQWEDRGWWLAWPAAVLILLWFRRGWSMRWSVWAVALLGALADAPARADGLADFFLTPDQQGRLAFEDKRYGEAAERFETPIWRAHALYRHGEYAEAIEVLRRLETADAAILMGLAEIRNRGYRNAVRAFETALEREPDNTLAARNLAVAQEIVAYVERAQEESSTGTGSEGADEIRYDKEAEGGTETEITGATELKAQSAEQWMRTVDTRTADFLRSRFALEAASR